jgi:hypothetical protein
MIINRISHGRGGSHHIFVAMDAQILHGDVTPFNQWMIMKNATVEDAVPEWTGDQPPTPRHAPFKSSENGAFIQRLSKAPVLQVQQENIHSEGSLDRREHPHQLPVGHRRAYGCRYFIAVDLSTLPLKGCPCGLSVSGHPGEHTLPCYRPNRLPCLFACVHLIAHLRHLLFRTDTILQKRVDDF